MHTRAQEWLFFWVIGKFKGHVKAVASKFTRALVSWDSLLGLSFPNPTDLLTSAEKDDSVIWYRASKVLILGP